MPYRVYAVKYLLVEKLSPRNDIKILDFMEKKLAKFDRETFFVTTDDLENLERNVDYIDFKVVKKLKEWIRRCGEGEYIVVWEDEED